MATIATYPKQQPHELIDRLSTGQVFAVVGLLEAMLDLIRPGKPSQNSGIVISPMIRRLGLGARLC